MPVVYTHSLIHIIAFKITAVLLFVVTVTVSSFFQDTFQLGNKHMVS